jgi:drug/metabolite transporter (DMT)-like permease
MTPARLMLLTSLAMLAFAGNSLLCRLALKHSGMDAASFTAVRLVAGALVLGLLVRVQRPVMAGKAVMAGDWRSALALFVYAAGFSFAYLSLTTATGALLLFGAVQATMIGFGVSQGERLRARQWLGVLLALSGLVVLLLPGLSAPPLSGAVLMLVAGVAWGLYSLRGKGASDPTRVTAGNFLRAVPLALGLSVLMHQRVTVDLAGFCYAMASGALASGLGYAIWYSVLPAMKTTHAATVQLSVPVLAALGGIVFLGEALSARMLLAAVTILGGIALVILEKKSTPASRR